MHRSSKNGLRHACGTFVLRSDKTYVNGLALGVTVIVQGYRSPPTLLPSNRRQGDRFPHLEAMGHRPPIALRET